MTATRGPCAAGIRSSARISLRTPTSSRRSFRSSVGDWGPEAAARLIDDFLPALRVVDVDASLRVRALASFRAAVETDVSFVDHTSFECMRQLGITRAYALNDDFTRAGFVLVS